MSSVTDWLDMMTQTVTIAPPSATFDSYGARTYGTPVSYPCRIVGKRTKVTDLHGDEVVSQQTVYLGTEQPIDPEAQVTISTGDAGSTEETAIHPQVLATGRYPDEAGAHHSVVYL